MRVAFDSDGVIDTFNDGVGNAFRARGLGHLWKSGPTPYSLWNYFEEWTHEDGTPWTYAEWKEIVDWGVDNGYIFTGHWRPCALESLRRVAQMGHEIIIITDRFFGSDPENSHKATIEAYARAGIEYDELHFTANKNSVDVDLFVEDRIENYDPLVEAGVPTWLINRAWNQVPGGDARNRIDCVHEYADAVERITEQGFADLTIS